MASRGVGIQGFWVWFPYTCIEPRKFATKEDALEFWPEPGSTEYPASKVVAQVWWQSSHPQLAPEVEEGFYHGDPLCLTNPLSYEAWEEERLHRQKVALVKKKEAQQRAKERPKKRKKEALN